MSRWLVVYFDNITKEMKNTLTFGKNKSEVYENFLKSSTTKEVLVNIMQIKY